MERFRLRSKRDERDSDSEGVTIMKFEFDGKLTTSGRGGSPRDSRTDFQRPPI